MGLFSRLFGRDTSAPAPPPQSAGEILKALYPDARPQNDEKPAPGERKLAQMLPHYAFNSGWSDDRIKQIHHFTYWLYVGVHAICKKMASLGSPNVGWVNSTAVARKSGSQRNRVWRKSQDVIKPHEEVEHVPLDFAALKLFDRPNAYDCNYDLWYELPLFKLLTGSTYLWTSARNGLGLPAELWVMPSHWTFPRSSDTKLIDYYEIRPYGGTAGMRKEDPGDMLHFRSKNPRSKIDGLGAPTAGAKWIDTSESVDSSRWAQMKNQMRPELVITLKPDVNPDDDELTRYYAKYQQRFGGEMKTGLPMILSGIEDVVPLQFPAEIFYIQTAEQMRDFVLCGLLSVPKEVVGMQPSGSDLSWWAPLHQFCTQAINPETKYMGQMLTRWVQQYEPSLRVWWDDCTPDNPDQINKDIAADFASGSITPNEIRAMRGREDYKNGGNDPLLPQTLSPFPMNTGHDLSGFADLMPGGQQEQPMADEFGNPVQPAPQAPAPLPPPAEAKPHDPMDPMANAREAFSVTTPPAMNRVAEIFAAGTNRMRTRQDLQKAVQGDELWTLPKPSKNGSNSNGAT